MCGWKRATASDSCSVQYVAGTVRGRRVREWLVMISDQGRPQEFVISPAGWTESDSVSVCASTRTR